MEEEKPNDIPQKWINTPFAFTRFSKNLSLLQQNILIKVSERLQPFVEQFFGTDLCKSQKRPKPLFSDAVKNSGIMQFDIPYTELGVAANNFYAAREAARKVLELKVSAPGFDSEGRPVMRDYNIFSFSEISAKTDRVVFILNNHVVDYLNNHVVDYVFDMTERYISHPDNIALWGKVDRMPMIYYLLRSSCNNKWKPEVKLTVSQIKEYLGMVEYVDGDKVKELYGKFSQFKKYVLDASISDINRLKSIGVLDVCVSYEPVYTGKRTTGNPFFIKFNIFDSIEKMKAYEANNNISKDAPLLQSLLNETEPQHKEEPTGLAEWKSYCETYDGKLSLFLEGFTFKDFSENILVLECTKALYETFMQVYNQVDATEKNLFFDVLKKCFGPEVRIQFTFSL